jgi:hypothetical protein
MKCIYVHMCDQQVSCEGQVSGSDFGLQHQMCISLTTILRLLSIPGSSYIYYT